MPPLAINSWQGLKKIVRYNLRRRNKHFKATGNYIYVYVWTIDDESQMTWLIKNGVDGIITNTPQILRNIYDTI